MQSDLSPFERALQLEPVGEGRYRTEIPAGWEQGRGAYGGLVMATLVRAIEREEPDASRSLRALTGEIPAPVAVGETAIATEVLRRGAGVTTTRAVLSQRGETLAQATGVLGSVRRGVPSWRTMAAPEMKPWRDAEVLPYMEGAMPAFAANMEFRNLGPLPFGGTESPWSEGWVRPRVAVGERGAAYLAALIDAWWPCALVRFDAPRPSATITFTLELVSGFEGLDPEAPLYYRATAPVTEEGYSVEFRELWGSDGRLLALNQQTFVIIK